MATCPDCGGYLEDSHSCTRAVRRRSQRGLAATAVAGGVTGAAVVVFLTSSHSLLVPALTAILGAFVAVSIYKAVPR